MTTFKTQAESLEAGLSIFPKVWTAMAYADVWKRVPFGTGILNTLTVAAPVILVGSFTSALGAFAFAKMRMPCSRIILLTLMSGMMVPFAALFLPQYQIWNPLGMTNHLLPLILPGLFGNISMVFFFIQFMSGIPNALFEAAKIDGCGSVKSFLHIMLPLLWPAMAAQGVFWFFGDLERLFRALDLSYAAGGDDPAAAHQPLEFYAGSHQFPRCHDGRVSFKHSAHCRISRFPEILYERAFHYVRN